MGPALLPSGSEASPGSGRDPKYMGLNKFEIHLRYMIL